MARTNTTPEQWAEAKALWESDTKISYADIGASLGISKQAVAKKANADRWQKRMDLPKVINRAHQEADKATIDPPLRLATFAVKGGKEAAKVDGKSPKIEGGPASSVEHVDAEPLDGQHMTLEQRAEAMAVAKRAEILARHRTELNGPRNLAYEAIKTKNFELGKLAKVSAEALNIVQTMERKAWGIDSGEKEGGAQTIIIDRG